MSKAADAPKKTWVSEIKDLRRSGANGTAGKAAPQKPAPVKKPK